MYARDKVQPRIAQVDQDKIASLYSELRRQSEIHGAIPITVRHLESIIRMSESSAKMRLSDWVRDEDVNLAIRVMIESFIQAQKRNVAAQLRKVFLVLVLTVVCGELTQKTRTSRDISRTLVTPRSCSLLSCRTCSATSSGYSCLTVTRTTKSFPRKSRFTPRNLSPR